MRNSKIFIMFLGLSIMTEASVSGSATGMDNPEIFPEPIGSPSLRMQIVPARHLTAEALKTVRDTEKCTTILLGRHGTTKSNMSGVTHGSGFSESISIKDQIDTESILFLSKLGEEGLVNNIYCAESDRCKVTSRLLEIGSEGELSVQSDICFNEQNFGDLKGRRPKDYFADDEFFHMASDYNYRMIYGGETLGETIDRLLIGILKYSHENEGKAIYIGTSRGCIAALEKFINGKRYEDKISLQGLYDIPNYYTLMIKYYNKSKIMELVYDEPVSPERAYEYLKQGRQTMYRKATRLLELAKKAEQEQE